MPWPGTTKNQTCLEENRLLNSLGQSNISGFCSERRRAFLSPGKQIHYRCSLARYNSITPNTLSRSPIACFIGRTCSHSTTSPPLTNFLSEASLTQSASLCESSKVYYILCWELESKRPVSFIYTVEHPALLCNAPFSTRGNTSLLLSSWHSKHQVQPSPEAAV